jgi:hypothetical protein
MNILKLETPPARLDDELNALDSAQHSIIDLASLDLSPAMHLTLQFIFNMVVCAAIVWFFYYPKSRNKGFSVTFMLFSAVVFFLLYFMGGVSLDITVGLGLFMIFGIMRYRTEMVPIREMTYLFVSIATAVINGINTINDQLILANLLLIALLAVIEYGIGRKREVSKLVCYERIELIRPDRRAELIADLEERLGHKVLRVDIGNVDFLRDVAYIKVYYHPKRGEVAMSDSTLKINEKNAFNA